MTDFNILFFGDSRKQVLLDDFDLRGGEIRLLTAEDEGKAFSILDSTNPQVVIVDFDQAGFKPLIFLDRILEKSKESIIFGLTENNHLDIVVKAIKMGVRDVIHTEEEPFKLQQELSRIIEKDMGVKKGEALHQKQKETYDFHNIIGQSREMQRIFEIIERIVQRKWITVLILGETGTGKEMIARAIHYKSFSHNQPFVEINCSTLPENLLESELFGHEKGAFTDAKVQKKGLFELAHNGTLFLDEIGDISAAIQLKLLKAIEDKKIRRLGGTKDIYMDARIITATNRDLLAAIHRGLFRNDLYYRLNVVSIHLPPLRERGDDVLILARKFLADYAEEYSSSLRSFTKDAEALLREYDWPGNVRELKHAIERIVLLKDGDRVERMDLLLAKESEVPLFRTKKKEVTTPTIDVFSEDMSLDDGVKVIIRSTLEKTGWNKARTCKILNISRPRLDRQIGKYSLAPNWNN